MGSTASLSTQCLQVRYDPDVGWIQLCHLMEKFLAGSGGTPGLDNIKDWGTLGKFCRILPLKVHFI